MPCQRLRLLVLRLLLRCLAERSGDPLPQKGPSPVPSLPPAHHSPSAFGGQVFDNPMWESGNGLPRAAAAAVASPDPDSATTSDYDVYSAGGKGPAGAAALHWFL